MIPCSRIITGKSTCAFLISERSRVFRLFLPHIPSSNDSLGQSAGNFLITYCAGMSGILRESWKTSSTTASTAECIPHLEVKHRPKSTERQPRSQWSSIVSVGGRIVVASSSSHVRRSYEFETPRRNPLILRELYSKVVFEVS